MGSTPKKRLELLLIEDSPADVQLVDVALRETGLEFRLTFATDGERAFTVLGRSASGAFPLPNLILMDLNLPKIGGIEILKFIKSDNLLKKIPLVVLTSSAAPADIEACYRLQANSFVSKPVELDAFFGMVEKVALYWLDTAKLPSSY